MTDQEHNLTERLAAMIALKLSNGPLLVAVSGKDGSGKTYLANQLAGKLRAHTKREIIRISIDDFMNERTARKQNPDQAVGCYEDTFNLDAFEALALQPLKSGTRRYTNKVFDYASDTPEQQPHFEIDQADAIVIIDGVFLYQDRLNDYWDVRLQLEANEDILIERGAQRDTGRKGSYESAIQAYCERYMPSQQFYYKTEVPLEKADVIIDVNIRGYPVITALREGDFKKSLQNLLQNHSESSIVKRS